MNRYIKREFAPFLLLLLSVCLFWVSSVPVYAADTEIKNVYDNASLLNDEDLSQLDSQCQTVNDARNINIVILIADSINGNRKQYLEDYYDGHTPTLSDAVLLLLNMDKNDRGIEIQGYGNCEFYLSDDRINLILDDMMPYLKDGEYFDALEFFISQVDSYMGQKPTTHYAHTEADNQAYNEANGGNPDEDSFAERTLIHLGIALFTGVVSVAAMAYHSSGRNTTSQGTYLDANNSRVLGRWDRYLRTTTTRRRKPEPNQSSGGGSSSGGGVSSGGNSHSGGGRSF